MASSPITSWQIDGETMETSTDFIFFLSFSFFLCYNIVLVLTYIDMNPPQYICVPHPERPSLLAPCTIPLGCPSAPAPSIQYHALNLDWRFISNMILYMFQCHSPKSSHSLHIFNFQNFLTHESSDFNLAFLALKIFPNESLF